MFHVFRVWFFFPFVFVLPEKNSFDGEEEEDSIEYPHRQKRETTTKAIE